MSLTCYSVTFRNDNREPQYQLFDSHKHADLYFEEVLHLENSPQFNAHPSKEERAQYIDRFMGREQT